MHFHAANVARSLLDVRSYIPFIYMYSREGGREGRRRWERERERPDSLYARVSLRTTLYLQPYTYVQRYVCALHTRERERWGNGTLRRSASCGFARYCETEGRGGHLAYLLCVFRRSTVTTARVMFGNAGMRMRKSGGGRTSRVKVSELFRSLASIRAQISR